MPLPTPEPGLVICYEFLWSHERDQGFEDGEKRRPALILSVDRLDQLRTKVIVVPITHRTTSRQEPAIEIPAAVRAHLGLDNKP